ncbi:hypothetical protein D3C76_856170 [compost metagenome]
MLNRIAIEAAFPVVQRLDERKLRLLPAQNSPLMSLTMSVDNTLVDNSLAENTDIISVLQSRAGDDAHRIAKADIIRLASASVSRLHDISKNQVLPAIKELATKVQEYVNARRLEASLPYSVVMKEIPAVYSNPALRQLAERYPNPSQMDYIARSLAEVTVDRVKELVKTGMAGFDAELDLCLSVKNNEGYAAVMDVLCARANVNSINQDYLPGVLVAAQSIYDEPEPGVNLTLVEYNDNVNRLLGRTAQLMRGAMLRYDEQDKLGLLYSSDGRESLTQIVVMGKTYRAMLEKGLTPEALIGNEMASRRFTQGQLIENKGILEQIYNREMNMQAIKVQTSMSIIVRDALRGVIGTELAARDLGEGAVDASKTLFDLTAKVNASNCDDLNTLVTEIVCEVFYPRTDALTFIRLMNRVGATLAADTDPREVALMATIKYINLWLCRQLGLAQA